MTPDFSAFDKVEATAEKALERLEADLVGADDSILDELITILSALVVGGKMVTPTTANLKTIAKVFADIDRMLERLPVIRKAFQKYFGSYTTITGHVGSYFTDQGLKLKDYSALTKFLTETTADNLLQAGVKGEFRRGIVETIKTHITTGAPAAKLRKALAETIAEKPLQRYVSQTASDAIHQYSRQYTQALTEDLGLKYYFYKGTKIETSRGFCASKVGRAFTEAEVIGWASQDWKGKIPGTTTANIKTNLGGFRCRHLLPPVTKAVYDYINANQ